jgi:nucleotide-binding universal stress UspA family protein
MFDQAIRELVVAVDGTPRSAVAAEVTAVFANRLGVPVSLVRGCRPYLDFGAARAWVDDLAASLDATLKRVEVVHSTDVVDDVLALTSEIPGAVLCLASHGRTEVSASILGSVSRSVVDRSREPVLVVGPRAEAPECFAAVQVAYNGSLLAECSAQAGARWARQLGATLWLTRVGDPQSGVASADVTESADLQRLASQCAPLTPDIEWDVLHGNAPGATMCDWGAAHGVALYVAGAHSRGGLRELFIGSVAHDLVHRANRPVLLAGPSCG